LTTNNILWLALAALLLILGLFILTDLFDAIIDYVAYVLIVVGGVVIIARTAHMIYDAKRKANDTE